MDIQKIKKIKDAVEKFGVRFISMVDDTSFIFENVATTGQYLIKFEEDNGAFIFDATEPQIVNEPVKKQNEMQKFQENCKMLFSSMRAVFAEESFDSGVAKLKDTIKELPIVEDKSLKTFIEEKENLEPKQELNGVLEDLFGEQLRAFREMEKEAKSLIVIFNEEGDLINKKFIDLDNLKIKLEERAKHLQEYKEHAAQFGEIKNKIKEVFNNDEKMVNKFLENFDITKDARVSITKKLVSLKNQDKFDIDIKQTAKALTGIMENTLIGVAGTPMPATYNLASDNKFKTPGFFQFKCGKFSMNDVKTMINELDYFMSLIGDVGQEELKDISEAKMVLEYMYHSGQINDHVIAEVLKNFNEKYANDQADAYNNPDMRLAWQSREQQAIGNAQGMAV